MDGNRFFGSLSTCCQDSGSLRRKGMKPFYELRNLQKFVVISVVFELLRAIFGENIIRSSS